jgi:hypothetical protein
MQTALVSSGRGLHVASKAEGAGFVNTYSE